MPRCEHVRQLSEREGKSRGGLDGFFDLDGFASVLPWLVALI